MPCSGSRKLRPRQDAPSNWIRHRRSSTRGQQGRISLRAAPRKEWHRCRRRSSSNRITTMRSIVLARTHVSNGMYEQAIAELQKALASHRKSPSVLGALAHAYARAGHRQKALQVLDELKQQRGATFVLVWAHAGLGDKDQAFKWLEKSYEERRQRMVLAQCGSIPGSVTLGSALQGSRTAHRPADAQCALAAVSLERRKRDARRE